MAGMAAALGAALGVIECANANRAHIEVSRDDERVMVYIKQRGNVVRIRLEPKAALELAIAIAQKARKTTEEENERTLRESQDDVESRSLSRIHSDC